LGAVCPAFVVAGSSPDLAAPARSGHDWPIALCAGGYERSRPGMTIAGIRPPNEHGQNAKER
jgi:hypothetical protein